ncbi:MAG: hypothetical protein R2771_13605 [Saprospiraceae bacterium]
MSKCNLLEPDIKITTNGSINDSTNYKLHTISSVLFRYKNEIFELQKSEKNDCLINNADKIIDY